MNHRTVVCTNYYHDSSRMLQEGPILVLSGIRASVCLMRWRWSRGRSHHQKIPPSGSFNAFGKINVTLKHPMAATQQRRMAGPQSKPRPYITSTMLVPQYDKLTHFKDNAAPAALTKAEEEARAAACAAVEAAYRVAASNYRGASAPLMATAPRSACRSTAASIPAAAAAGPAPTHTFPPPAPSPAPSPAQPPAPNPIPTTQRRVCTVPCRPYSAPVVPRVGVIHRPASAPVCHATGCFGDGAGARRTSGGAALPAPASDATRPASDLRTTLSGHRTAGTGWNEGALPQSRAAPPPHLTPHAYQYPPAPEVAHAPSAGRCRSSQAASTDGVSQRGPGAGLSGWWEDELAPKGGAEVAARPVGVAVVGRPDGSQLFSSSSALARRRLLRCLAAQPERLADELRRVSGASFERRVRVVWSRSGGWIRAASSVWIRTAPSSTELIQTASRGWI